MSTKNARQRFPLTAKEALEEYRPKISVPQVALNYWDRLSDAERKLLGDDLDQAHKKGGIVGMWKRLFHVSDSQAILDIVRKLGFIDASTNEWLRREMKHEIQDPDDQFASIVETAPLVLRERPREAYWKGTKISIDWYIRSALWEFFWLLCEYSIQGTGIDHTCFAKVGDVAYPQKIESRFKSCLPRTQKAIGKLIIPHGRNTVILNLKPHEIRLFRTETQEILTEIR